MVGPHTTRNRSATNPPTVFLTHTPRQKKLHNTTNPFLSRSHIPTDRTWKKFAAHTAQQHSKTTPRQPSYPSKRDAAKTRNHFKPVNVTTRRVVRCLRHRRTPHMVAKNAFVISAGLRQGWYVGGSALRRLDCVDVTKTNADGDNAKNRIDNG